MAHHTALFRSRFSGAASLAALVVLMVCLAVAFSAGGTYAAPSDPSPGKESAAAPLASPTVVCGYDWYTVSSPNGPGASSRLNAVTALSPDNAWAVGVRTDSAGNALGPLAMHWDGVAWGLVPVPGMGSLNDVDAVATNDEWAVGTISSTLQPVAVHWDGTAWAETPLPTIGGGGSLYGVDARSTNDVWAVGTSFTGRGQMLVVHWDGNAWNDVSPIRQGSLGAVYAVAANDVWAVGAWHNRYWDEATIWHWDGSAWVEHLPGFYSTSSNLTDISGLSSDQIWAVGRYPDHTIVVRWDGTSWAPVYDAVQSDHYTGLEAIAPDNIWAVGPGGRLHWNGNIWNREALPDIVRLEGIVAVNSGDIWAVGASTSQSGAYTTLTQRYSYVCMTPTPMPTATATPIPPRCPTERFTDVCPADYFYEPVLALSDLNIINGYSTAPPCDGPSHIPCFKPYNGSTRGQIAKVVSLAAGFSEPVSGQTFEDVAPGSTFYEYIERMASRQIIQGYPCSGAGEPCVPPDNRPYFRPNNPVTRGQLSKMTSEAFGFSEPVSGQTFEDVAPGSTFYEWVQRIASRGIIQGYPCGGVGEPCGPESKPYFRPNNPVTRGQTAKIVHLAMLEPPPTPTATPCAYAWRTVDTPNSNQPSTTLTGIEAISSDDAWAVGYGWEPQTQVFAPFMMRWNGTAWNSVPVPVEQGRFLHAVSASSPNDIWAVGQKAYQGLALHWDGNSWTDVPVPTFEIASILYDVYALSANDAWAVGMAFTGSSVLNVVVLQWNGTAWSVVPTPAPGALYGVKALAPNDVWAVGAEFGRWIAPTFALILHWDGTAWAKVPVSIDGGDGLLREVAALSPTDVWAVGEYFSGTAHAIVLRWNGTDWQIAHDSTSVSLLRGIEAISASNVWVVGGGAGPSGAVRLHWNGSAWSPDTGPSDSWLEDISALNAGYIWAAGGRMAAPEVNATLTQRYSSVCPSPSPTSPPATATSTVAPTNTPIPPPSSTATSTPPTPQATPTCCNQITGSILAGCVGSAYQVTTTVTNSCGITLTANIATVFNVAPTENGPWQTLYVGDCFNCPVPPGTQQQTSNVYSGPLPPGNNWWRFSRGYYSTNGCWQLVLLSEPQPACVTPTPTPAPRAAPGP